MGHVVMDFAAEEERRVPQASRRRYLPGGANLTTACVLRAALVGCFHLGVRAGNLPSVAEHAFESQIVDIRWLGEDGRTLLLHTQNGNLHRSEDKGKTWTDITTKISEQHVKIKGLLLSPADTSTLIAVTTTGLHYASDDAGVNWRALTFNSGRIQTWWFHSTRKDWALASYWSSGCTWSASGKPPTEEDGPCTHALYSTKDFGKTFQSVARHIIQFSWGSGAQRDRVYFTHHRNKREHQKKLTRWMEEVDFAYTDDMGSTSMNLISSGNKFVISSNFILVATLQDAAKQNVVLKISSDGAASFDTAVMPQQNLGQKSYVILDASEGAIVLHVDHGLGIGHLYVSDSSGVHFSLSLANNLRANGDCAFEKVRNLKGIYIANMRDAKGLERHDTQVKPWSEDAEDHVGGLSTMTQTERAIRSLKENGAPRRLKGVFQNDSAFRRLAASDTSVRTVISFNKGGRWTYLKPPQVDSLGKNIDCPPDKCMLHLHGITDFDHFVPFYSYNNAVGIVMGTGNVGPHLSYKQEDTNTYLSRDGGLTWVEAHKGVYIYEFGNYGGLLIMTDWVHPTKQAIFSWNEGSTWVNLDVTTDTAIRATNILTEPHAKTTHFVMFGSRGSKGVLYYIDFEAMGQRPCQGLAAANAQSSDYETWTPSDGSGSERCLLGLQRLYTRKKQTAACFNTEGSEWPVTERHCACTQEDFECEVGFTRNIGSSTCVPEREELANVGVMGLPLEEMNDYLRLEVFEKCKGGKEDVFHTEAYRRVAGDTCKGGWTPPKATLPCPSDLLRPKGRGWGSIVLAGFCISALLGCCALLVVINGGVHANYHQVSGMRSHAGASANSAIQAAARFGSQKFQEMREVTARGSF